MRKSLTLLVLSFAVGTPMFGLQQAAQGDDFEVKTLSPLSASQNKQGDKFTVQVLSPEGFRNALIEGAVVNSKAAGKVKGKSELLFRFDKLVLTDRREIPIQADLIQIKNSKGVANVDEEGRAIGRPSKWKDILMVGAASAAGAGIGAAASGQDRKTGAAKGAAIGAALGLTIAFSTRGEDIRLAEGSVFVLRVTAARRTQ